jgi:hypothetical protein
MTTDTITEPTGHGGHAGPPPVYGKYPPVAELATLSIVLVIIGGIYMASYIPRLPPLGLPIAILSVAAAIFVVNLYLVFTLKDFARQTFLKVTGWAFFAYAITSGMIEYAFVKDGTRGDPLLVVTLMLVIFATNVPIVIGFTTARFVRRDQ